VGWVDTGELGCAGAELMYRHPFWNSRIGKNCRKYNDIRKSMKKVLTPTAGSLVFLAGPAGREAASLL